MELYAPLPGRADLSARFMFWLAAISDAISRELQEVSFPQLVKRRVSKSNITSSFFI